MSSKKTDPTLPRRNGKILFALLMRMHFYVGLLVGPFILVAALSGIVYVLTPSVESWLYRDALTVSTQDAPQPLARQIETAQWVVGQDTLPAAVRPAPDAHSTTRVMFADPALGPSEHRAIFIDPATLDVKGDMTVYGTSGILPFRTALDQFHRSLLLGDVGRLYSELAASWLWIIALLGLVLWLARRKALKSPSPRMAARRLHATVGVFALVGLLFFSATGLTWSQWAGGNIGELRQAWGWGTPSVSTVLPAPGDAVSHDSHAHHDMHADHGVSSAPEAGDFVSPEGFDQALAAARSAGLLAGRIQLEPPASEGRAWRVSEIDRRWPTQVDQVALNPSDMRILEQTDFSTFPLAAKLTRWGIDLHMGVLFGLLNQLVLALFAAALVFLIVWGYRMWWQRVKNTTVNKAQTMTALFIMLGVPAQLGLLAILTLLGFALPVLGGSLIIIAIIDALRWAASRKPRSV
ncbi:PepSY-associated TM helix domain-containing protein [Halomonas sp. AOP43-D1-4]|uniref:PepSY-associated TM helix domain-containing protein n=1 Tax=Halomonas sp. AOP43-D1-4 TaxID=3457658 RepID=UPI00403390BF